MLLSAHAAAELAPACDCGATELAHLRGAPAPTSSRSHPAEAASAPNGRAAAPVPSRGRPEEPARGAALSDVGIPRVFLFPARIHAPRRSRELAQPRRDVAHEQAACGRGEAARTEGASPLAGEEGPRSSVLLRSAEGRVGGTHRGGGSRASSEEGAREAGQLAGGAARASTKRAGACERERERGIGGCWI